MCTVSFIYKGNQEFVLTSNRDESPERATEIPAVYEILGTKMIFPKDTVAGGTWIGMSEKKRVVCLLNGGFTPHERLPEYRHSRGVVVRDFLASDAIIETVKSYNLDQIEPFTIIIVDWHPSVQLYELIWNGKKKHFQELPVESHIWSSSTLYTEEMKELRRNWFADFQLENVLDANTILKFHKTAGVGDPTIDTIMDRGEVKTISITQVEKIEDTIKMNYHNMLDASENVIAFNTAELLDE